jgi:hypothetical protein
LAGVTSIIKYLNNNRKMKNTSQKVNNEFYVELNNKQYKIIINSFMNNIYNLTINNVEFNIKTDYILNDIFFNIIDSNQEKIIQVIENHSFSLILQYKGTRVLFYFNSK